MRNPCPRRRSTIGLRLALLGAALCSLTVARPAQCRQGVPARAAERVSPDAARALDRALRRRAFDVLRPALAAHLEHVRARDANAAPAAGRARTLRLVRYIAGRLARQGARVDGGLLPATLPPLPATSAAQAQLQGVIDEGIARTHTAKDLYLYLEEQASILRGSVNVGHQTLARQLVGYLAGYKESWAPGWIAGRLFDPPRSGGRSPAGSLAVRFGRRGQANDAYVPLPPLPATGPDEQDVQRAINAGVEATRQSPTPQALCAHLEGKVHELRVAGDRQLARRLSRYLSRYRAQWTVDWLSPAQRAEVRRQVAEGGRRVAQVVDGEVLRRVPEVKVLVSPFYGVAGIVSSKGPQKLINIVPDTAHVARDTMHEYGHVVEDSDLRIFAAAHGLLRQRAYGTGPQGLASLIPLTSYTESQKGLAAGFVDPYMGRWYRQGWTEVLSTALERLESPQSALDFFKADGWHFLVATSAFRRGR